MANSHVVSGLLDKRAEISGLINKHQSEINKLNQSLDALDSTIKLFSPEIDLRHHRAKTIRERNRFFKNGECIRLILDVLREAEEPLTPVAITDHIIALKTLSVDSEETEHVRNTVYAALAANAKKGLIKQIRSDAGSKTWALTE